MFSKERLLDVLRFTHQQETAFVDNLTPEQRDAVGRGDDWSAKDVSAHLSVWKDDLVHRALAGARGERIPEDERPDDEINAEIYAEHESKSWNEVRRMAEQAHQRLMDFVSATPERILTDPELSLQADGRAIWQAVIADYVSHTITHLSDFYLHHGEPQRAITLQEAATAQVRQFEDPLVVGFGFFELACVYARAGRIEDGIRALGEALRLEPRLTPRSQRDPALEALRSEPSYHALYA